MKKFVHLIAYSLVSFCLLIGLMFIFSSLSYQKENTHQSELVFGIVTSLISLGTIFLLKKKNKKTSKKMAITKWQNWIEFLIFIVGFLVVLIGVFFTKPKGLESAFDYGSGSLFISIIFSWLLIPILGLLKISKKQKHPAEDYAEFMKAVLIKFYTKKSGIVYSIFVLSLLVILGDSFSLGNSNSLDGDYAWLPFTALMILISFIVFLTIFGNFICFIGRLFDKKVRAFSEYAYKNVESSFSKKAGGLGFNVGGFYFGWMFFKIQIISSFLMILFLGNEFRPAAFILSLLFLAPDFYKFFIKKD